ncbi:alpha-ketoacid dehydrogenase subunit beta [Chitinasiproducens palmae]|uniref:Pyruvate dehydrogenase E1 component beta subunit n=1 Tax=Chitinasiproducens palmae TaxID=1770053 RepID=A0A1H2PQA5_9BURK|nr:transketolase C-terminal domain-containing protein [Chitinasiproducens palmae]SDV48984.1 pyruvate dehydrogenase E1 component beta subunit [Chitinasiproducens palmae]
MSIATATTAATPPTALQATPPRTLNYAQAAALALEEAMRDDPSVVALGEDLGRGGVFGQYRDSAGLPLARRFGGERIIDTPISEAAIVGAAVGMALAGLRPVVELRVIDFALCAIDELVNQAAKNRFMFGGQGRVPLVARMPIGLWGCSAAQHSQSLEAWFTHIPGLTVVAPSTPQDNYALLHAALNSRDPVVYLEHKELWGLRGEVALAGAHTDAAELGKAAVRREGSDLTVVTWSRTVHEALAAAETASDAGIDVEVIDLRTLWPWDRDAVFASARKTGRVLVAHEAVQVSGFGAEIAASVAEHTEARVARLGAPRIPVGYGVLESEARVERDRIGQAIARLAERPRGVD